MPRYQVPSPDRLISSFAEKRNGKLEHLPASNFFPSPFDTKLGVAPTIEHYFAAAKTLDDDARIEILAAPTPGAAKRMGRHVRLRPDWESVKLGVMTEALRRKFDHVDSPLGQWLLSTDPYVLVEGNTWGDTFWGVVTDRDGHQTGDNWLGQLLMIRRAELRAIASCVDGYEAPLPGPTGFDDLMDLAVDLGCFDDHP